MRNRIYQDEFKRLLGSLLLEDERSNGTDEHVIKHDTKRIALGFAMLFNNDFMVLFSLLHDRADFFLRGGSQACVNASRTFSVSFRTVKGFWRKWTPSSSTP